MHAPIPKMPKNPAQAAVLAAGGAAAQSPQDCMRACRGRACNVRCRSLTRLRPQQKGTRCPQPRPLRRLTRNLRAGRLPRGVGGAPSSSRAGAARDGSSACRMRVLGHRWRPGQRHPGFGAALCEPWRSSRAADPTVPPPQLRRSSRTLPNRTAASPRRCSQAKAGHLESQARHRALGGQRTPACSSPRSTQASCLRAQARRSRCSKAACQAQRPLCRRGHVRLQGHPGRDRARHL